MTEAELSRSSSMRTTFAQLSRPFREFRWPRRAKAVLRIDRCGLPDADLGAEAVVRECLRWIGRAQDCSTTRDGGIARDFSLIDGWSSSYPESTGYVVPTVLEYARRTNNPRWRDRARQMLDWIVSIQLPEGGFHGGTIDCRPRVPVTFNTGQILLGLAAGVKEFGDSYREPMNRAATWLRDSLDGDGCWRRYPTPFAAAGEKAYETHVAWGLFEAARLEPRQRYAEAGLAQIAWAITKQSPNGFFRDCCLTDATAPLTHTLGYTLRGILEAYLFAPSPHLLESACRLANALLRVQEPNGRLAGRYDSSWRTVVPWACLTGIVQISLCWLILFRLTGDARFRDGGFAANRYVRRTVNVTGERNTRGGVKGSFPVDGSYGAFQYLSWAAKFCVDANLLEMDIRREHRNPIA